MEIFKAKRIYRKHEFLLQASPDQVFPLLCPIREYDWIESWKCDLIYSESSFAENDCIFTTHFSNEENETWVVDKYEMNKQIQFIRFTKTRVIRHSISLIECENNTTKAVWEQLTTSLNSEGNIFIENFPDEEYTDMVKRIEKMLNYYLLKGIMLHL